MLDTPTHKPYHIGAAVPRWSLRPQSIGISHIVRQHLTPWGMTFKLGCFGLAIFTAQRRSNFERSLGSPLTEWPFSCFGESGLIKRKLNVNVVERFVLMNAAHRAQPCGPAGPCKVATNDIFLGGFKHLNE